MVAGGGGGGSRGNVEHLWTYGKTPGPGINSMIYQRVYGGVGGGLVGGTGSGSYNATGVSQTAGGKPLAEATGIMNIGRFGIGGTNTRTTDFREYGCNGGGGGYYGGGASSRQHGAGGGGSSFVSGYEGCDAISEASTENAIIHTGQSAHYSGYVFANSQIIAGDSAVPTHDGTGTMLGNSGHGFAKITYLG